MIDIKNYIDSTYLKTPPQAQLTEQQTKEKVISLLRQAIDNGLFCVMIRPEYVKMSKEILSQNNSDTRVGTVIGFHEGTSSIREKYTEAELAIQNGADELDFVLNYTSYKEGKIDLIKKEVLECTQLCLQNKKIIKWIVEIAALSDAEIADVTNKISTWCEENFSQEELANIFVKSSTGFYPCESGKNNGATFEGIKIMLINSGKLSVKAAGGVRTKEDAMEMIKMGVLRIGTSSAIDLL